MNPRPSHIGAGLASPDHRASIATLPAALEAAGFRGDVLLDPGSTAPFATDNSIYRIPPDMVVAPRDAADVACLMRVMSRPDFCSIPVTARGGGTGTNAQSLNLGVIVNFQKYMCRILAVNVEEGWADVEPGVVPDVLNRTLAADGLMFAATTSTVTRCTIGGMVATDASGKGSRHHGKTGDNVLELDLVLSDGTEISSGAAVPAAFEARAERVADAIARSRDEFIARVPHLARRFTGYDLDRALGPDGRARWMYLVIGAEGTLGLVTRIRVRLRRRPAFSGIAVLSFATVSDALEAGGPLLAHDPAAIEIMDDIVFRMAQEAGLLAGLPRHLIGGEEAPALCYLEAEGASIEDVERVLRASVETARGLTGFVGSHLSLDRDETSSLWAVRSGSVALVARSRGRRAPIPFIEDCAVPLDELSGFTRAFVSELDQRGLSYGMYGHVDVGCVHIRPALDLANGADRALIGELTDVIFALVQRHGGIFWGEHGKGVRGALLPRVLGPAICATMLEIRRAFDPHLRMNPGKLVDLPEKLWQIEGTPLRTVLAPDDAPAPDAFLCNGNGECLGQNPGQAMCPSFRATHDLRLSPKGRADMLRDWQVLRQTDPAAASAMEPAIVESLDLCLACKACSTNCQARVDVPEMRSRFLGTYHRDRPRSLEARLFIALEGLAPVLDRLRRPAAALARLATPVLGRALGLRDLPRLVGTGPNIPTLSRRATGGLPPGTVLLLPDPFTQLFDPAALTDIASGLRRLGYHPVLAELPPGGKAAHNFGDRAGFRRRALRLDRELARLARLGVPMIAADAAFLAGLRHDHARIGLGLHGVTSVSGFLAQEAAQGRAWPRLSGKVRILPHCTEMQPGDALGRQWRQIGAALGLDIEVSGGSCCGMAGHFGHLERHAELSRSIYDTNWRARVETAPEVYVGGFSCRCQVERMSNRVVRHPLAAIAALPLAGEVQE